ncbi:hypothetical protein MTR_5g058575 [Medicago truncatula]|uniref:Uncharacterized protein n=1 Tax=Medicago truncatula TaxID=3880 RepID=A0A072UF00_MEDTR|nr:hypothetical protein MTR_5g058575 [Medicago truncatula]
MASKRKSEEIEASGSGASKKQSTTRIMGSNSRIPSKEIDITNPEMVENYYVGTNPHVHNDGNDGGDEEEERILDGLSLGAKERDLALIRYENTKIWRQNMFPPKSEAWHDPC